MEGSFSTEKSDRKKKCSLIFFHLVFFTTLLQLFSSSHLICDLGSLSMVCIIFFLDETMAPPPPPPGLVLRMDYSSPILNSQQQSVVGVTNASKMRS